MDKGKNRWNLCREPLLAWLALVALLGITCALAFVPMGRLNLPLSLGIAFLKAALVGVIFMRLREDRPLHRLAASIGPIWIVIMLLLTGTDYFTR
jgi:cytochrome c oxidase subunit 4